ncbi:RING finger protein 112-like isoform X2 [Chiloscyllium punctatum]|uniref:RING finger protein 112-like isoform X2 n=1 Tax=Chiloscyllium punctatum TaxID=137246 RepID=UPI003B635D22
MSPVSGESLQLAYVEKDALLLNEEAFKRCFLREDVKDGPVCLISIIGEERKGKSFLLNYFLRRLCHQECNDKGWMGKSNEVLKGFEYRPGIHTITKGVFIWSEPFLIDTERGKMAVFLVDTEGCDGHERSKGLSVQLSALSMLLSSYMIFNVASKINRTDLEYLEMFLDMAEKHLDILVRDWECSENYGKDSGKEYLLETEKKIQNLDSKYCRCLLKQLSKCECFLLPNPGESIRKSTTGCWKDMREDFRNSLDDYLSSVLRSLPTGARTDNRGSVVSGLQVFERMQLFTKTIETYSQDITTPLQMVNAIQAMKLREKIRKDFQSFLHFSEVNVDDDDDICEILKTSPMSMRNRLETKANELKGEFNQQLELGEEQREREVTELDNLLKEMIDKFCTAYTREFHRAICILRDRLLQEFKGFIEQQEVNVDDDDDISEILKTSPMSMRNRLETKANELMEKFTQQLELGEEQKEREVTELDNLLKEMIDKFCTAYTREFHRAICTLRDRLLQEFKGFIEQQEVNVDDDDDISEILKTSPMSMRNRLETKANELKDEFNQQLELGEEQREREVTELDNLLKELIDKFHTREFHRAICILRDRLLQEFKGFIEQQEHDSDGLFKCVKTRPSQMRKLLEVKEKELIEKFGNSVRGRLEERERAMDKLQSRLHREKEIFCRKHSNNFTKGVITLGTGAIGAVGGLVAASVLVPGTAVAVVVEGAGAALGLGTRSGVCMVLAAVGAGAGVWAGLRARVNTVMKRA